MQEGTWKNDQAEGTGVFKWANGIQWQGNFKEDKGSGNGRYSDLRATTPNRYGIGKLELPPDLLWLKANL